MTLSESVDLICPRDAGLSISCVITPLRECWNRFLWWPLARHALESASEPMAPPEADWNLLFASHLACDNETHRRPNRSFVLKTAQVGSRYASLSCRNEGWFEKLGVFCTLSVDCVARCTLPVVD